MKMVKILFLAIDGRGFQSGVIEDNSYYNKEQLNDI